MLKKEIGFFMEMHAMQLLTDFEKLIGKNEAIMPLNQEEYAIVFGNYCRRIPSIWWIFLHPIFLHIFKLWYKCLRVVKTFWKKMLRGWYFCTLSDGSLYKLHRYVFVLTTLGFR